MSAQSPEHPVAPQPSAAAGAAPGDPERPLLAVLAAEDLLGESVVREALVQGLRVRAVTSDPRRLPRLSPALEVRTADLRDQSALARAVAGADAVILGLDPGRDLGADASAAAPTDPAPLSREAAVIAAVRALRTAGIDHLVVASSAQLAPEGGAAGADRPLRRLAREVGERRHADLLRDLRRMERLLEGSGLDTVVVRSPRIVEDLGTRQQRLVPMAPDGGQQIGGEQIGDEQTAGEHVDGEHVGGRRRGCARIPREDLARALISCALAQIDPDRTVPRGARVMGVTL